MTREEKRVVALSASGQVIEFYDFVIFVMLGNIISSQFFTGSAYSRLFYLFGVFAFGYVVRPLGGIIFGHLGDTIGRKKTFIATIFLISASTFCMGLIPSYKSIGMAAPLIFIFLRALQGISLGGELPGAVSFVYEHMGKEEKTFGTSLIWAGANIGFLLAGFVSSVCYCFQIDIAWRIAFLTGGILGFVVCLLRRKISETPVFEKLLENKQILCFPIIELFKKNFIFCILGISILCFTAYGALFIVLLPNILPSYTGYFLQKDIVKINTFSMLLLTLGVPVFGYIVGKLRLNIFLFFAFSCISIIALAYPLFLLLQMHSLTTLFLAYSVFAISYAMAASAEFHILAKLFPPSVEYTGVGIAVNIGGCISYGFIPIIALSLFHYTDSLHSIAYILIIIYIFPALAGIILFLYPPDKKKFRELDREIRKLYNLDILFEENSLTLKEEIEFKKRLDEFADKIVKDQILFKKEDGALKLCEHPNQEEISKLNIKDISTLTPEEQKKLYQQCKYILTTKAEDQSSVISKYKSLLQDNIGNKYYTYFYARLIIKELIALNNNSSLTAKDINALIEQRLNRQKI